MQNIHNFLMIDEVIKRLEIKRDSLKYLMKTEMIPRSLYLINGQDIEHTPKKVKYLFIKEKFEEWYKQQMKGMVNIAQLKGNYGEMITLDEAAKILGVTNTTLLRKMNEQDLTSLYVLNGKEFKSFNSSLKYLFILDKVKEFKEKKYGSLMTIEEAEVKFGPLISVNEAAIKIQIDYKSLVQLLENQGYFLVEKGKHLIESVNGIRYLKVIDFKHVKKFISNQKEKKQRLNKNNTLVPADNIARWRGYDVQEFRKECEEGKWDHAVADYVVNTYGRKEFYFYKKALKDDEYQSAREIAWSLAINRTTVNKVVEDGLLEGIKKTTNGFVLKADEVKEKIKKIQIENRKKMGSPTDLKYFDLLPLNVQGLIDEYLEERQAMERFQSMDGIQFKKIKNQDYVEKTKRVLSNMFFKIVCLRSGIELDYNLKTLPEENYEKIDFESFTIESITKKEVIDLLKFYGDSKGDYSTILRPFLSWIYYKEEMELDEDDANEFKRVAKMKKNFSHLMNLMPTRTRKNSKRKFKVFMNREQVIKTYKAIRTHPTITKKFEYSLMWMLGVFAQVRPEELMKLRIFDFELNKDGYLKEIDEDGYGRLWIEAERSKGGYSPSHPIYGTLLVPRLVKYINLYLKKIYEHQKPGTDGYLFRPLLHSPDVPFKRNSNGWIPPLRKALLFLPEEEREFVELKTSRRSSNNIVRNYTSINDPLIKGFQIRAAEVHMRHDIYKKGGTINDIYTQEVPYENYKKIIDEALNFPWDLDELKVWEMEKGYVNPNDVNANEAENEINKQMLEDKKLEKIRKNEEEENEKKERLEKLIQEFDSIKTKPQEMEALDWLKKRKILKNEIDLLKKGIK